MNIGFIGLGNMGLPMAENLQKAGYEVVGFDIKKDVNTSVKIANNFENLIKDNEVIFTMLPSGNEVSKVYNEIVTKCESSTVMVDCSTIDINNAHFISDLAKKNKLQTLDAPVSGGVVGAIDGTLTFMVGGDQKAFKKIKPLFEIMGKKAVYCGDSGSGQAAKMCNNMILGISMIGVCEAFSLAKNIGLDVEKLFEVSSNSSGSCWALNTYCPVPGIGPKTPADNSYIPGFSSELMLKDLSLAQSAAKQSNSHTPLGANAKKIYEKLLKEGGKGKDFSYILPFFSKKSRN
ncbi:MAG: 3-hydroxyisobutyrate dehydrogenase [Paracoccaceae bacterium]